MFTFNSEGKIESLAFGLDDIATKDVLTKQAWPETARMAIIEFLENYKTAFALERLDYIRPIFDDNAVIIVGKVAKVAPSPAAENQLTLNNHVITRTRVTKEQYLKNLERCFDSNEFVNIRFANNDIVKAGVGGEYYNKVLSITDRREAIRTAVALAKKGDIILVAGKGHEDYQEIKGVKHHFDDVEELTKAFNEK